jgi:CelD/BcsL family acetyltransferase involved in cellulose biosynthesis
VANSAHSDRDARTARVLERQQDLGAVEEDWRMLAEQRGNAFVTPEWYGAWMRHYGRDVDPAIVVVHRQDGRVRGLLPLVRARSGVLRALRFGGGSLGDYFHPVALTEDESVVAMESARALCATEDGWRSMILDHVPVEHRWWGEMSHAVPVSLSTAAYRGDVVPLIEFEGRSWDEYLATRSRNMRSQVRRKTRALAREHQMVFRRTRDPAELADDLRTFFRLHDERWAGRGGSTSSSLRSRDFHADFAAAALARDWLRLWFLEVDDEPVAAWYGWNLGGRYSYYLSGFSSRWARFSVGFVLLAHTIHSAIEEQATEYDLLLGAEPYKSRFATSERAVRTVVITRAGHPARLLIAGEAALWRARRRLRYVPGGRAQAVYRTVASRLPTSRRR